MDNFTLVCLALLLLRDAFMFMIWKQSDMRNVLIKFSFLISVSITVFIVLMRMGFIVRL